MIRKEHFYDNRKRFGILIILLVFSVVVIFTRCNGLSSETSVNLENGFLNPPESAKPRVWWHWMNGNITKEGIKADLEWMKRVGIGGFQNFDAKLKTPQIVQKRLVYMTPEWKDAFLYATKLADSLNLEMAIAGSPGWSESGGPWVTPAGAMKKFVWSEIQINGGQLFKDTVPKPISATGNFKNIGVNRVEGSEPVPEFYADAAVVAYRVPEDDISMEELHPNVTSSRGPINLDLLIDGDLAKTTFLPEGSSHEKSWIQYQFSQPVSIQSVTVAAKDQGCTSERMLEASDDGRQFKEVLKFAKDRAPQTTVTFTPVKARFFRLTFLMSPLPANGQTNTNAMGIQVAELVLHTSAQVNRFEDKAGFATAPDLYELGTSSVSDSYAISPDDVIDLTAKLHPDGTLDWTPPEGRWAILRVGYSLTGKKNHPASPEGTGLEVDKLSREHVKAYFENYLDQYKDATGGMMGKRGLQYMITDSWEAGTLNWTDNMMEEFKKRRGYDLISWLPALTGHIVKSAAASDRFLWDFRQTISELIAENHYDQLTTLLHERGMGRYTESHEGDRVLIADGMEIKRTADIPMSATWTPKNTDDKSIKTVYKADVRESASVAHIYGQNLVAAESLTTNGIANFSGWGWCPESLKPTADMELSCGLNRFVIHCSVHQPVFDKTPGLGLGPYGQWFTRNETWAEQAKPWINYLSRSSYMLQQGKFVADVAYFYGEDNNITSLFKNKLPDIPASYNYDFVNADILVNILSVNQQKQIVTPSGMSYRLLALDPNARYMSLSVLRKINQLVEAGAVVVGEKPVGAPGLSDDGPEFKTIADRLWANQKGENIVGKGKVYCGLTIAEVLTSLQILPDFEYTKPQSDTELLFVHRKLDDIDIYWVNNRSDSVKEVETTFRVKGKTAEIWHPDTGIMENVSYRISGELTTVPLKLESNDAVFVVFRKKAKSSSLKLTNAVETQLAVIDGVWNLSFQPNRGAPEQIALDQLTSWSENSNPGVKYFSGTGTYIKTIQAPVDWFKEGSQIWLDLGDVQNLAEVVLNGTSLGILWKSPFRINVTEQLKQGENKLEVKVTNLWVNRLIGDQQPETKTPVTYTTQAFYQANSPLLPSGLMGPVKVVSLSVD